MFRPAFATYLEYITLQLIYPNVPLRTAETWRRHLSRLRKHSQNPRTKAAYRVLSKAINAADYGAAQKRHRAIFIGLAAEFGDAWSFPKPTHSQEALAWAKHVDGGYWREHSVRRIAAPSSESEAQALRRVKDAKKTPKENPWVTVRDVIADLPTASKRELVEGHWQHPGARAYEQHTGSCLDEPAKALKAGDHGVPGGENMLASKNGAVRYFTVRKMARLQGFPDDFCIRGSWKAATRQLGNAVPIKVGESIGKAVLSSLEKNKRRR